MKENLVKYYYVCSLVIFSRTKLLNKDENLRVCMKASLNNSELPKARDTRL